MTFADAGLTDAFRRLVPQPVRTARPTRPATVVLGFGGGGQPLVAATTDPVQFDVPFPCRLAWARLRAGDALGQPVAVSATVDVQLSQFEQFGGSSKLYATGTMPALSGTYKADLSLSGWHIDLAAGDTVMARLATFSGSATWLTLSLLLRPTDVPVRLAPVLNASGLPYVDASGAVYVMSR